MIKCLSKIFVLATLFCGLQLSAQTKAVVSATKLNILYKGIENPISIAFPSLLCSELIIEVKNAEIKGEGCSYMLKPKKVGKTVITIKRLMNQDTIMLDEYVMRVKSLPMPTAYFAGFSGINLLVEKQFIAEAKGVSAQFEHLHFDLHIQIESFDLLIKKANGSQLSLNSNSARITNEMKEEIKKLQSGEQLSVNKIMAIAPNKENWELRPIQMTIK